MCSIGIVRCEIPIGSIGIFSHVILSKINRQVEIVPVVYCNYCRKRKLTLLVYRSVSEIERDLVKVWVVGLLGLCLYPKKQGNNNR